MIGMALAGVALAGEVAAGPLADLEREQQALFARVQPSIVVISDGRSVGSGFFVSRDGLILTCAQVAGTAAEVDVVTPEGNKLRGKVIERAAGVDLALIEVPWKQSPPLVLSRAPLRMGAWVGAVGHGMGGVWSFTTGMISSVSPQGQQDGQDGRNGQNESLRPVFQIQIPLEPGNAGGPVFDKDGRVVGIVTAGSRAPSGVHFAIRADLALTRLTRLADRCDCLVLEAARGTLLFVDDQHAGSGPRVVWPVTPGEHEVMATMAGRVWRQKVRFPETRKLAVPAELPVAPAPAPRLPAPAPAPAPPSAPVRP
jgi:serine protease Do